MKSAIYCEHANESPLYETRDGKLVCRCPEDCYCKHDGGCRTLQRARPTPQPRFDIVNAVEGHGSWSVVIDGVEKAHCTSSESFVAAQRLLHS